MGWWVSTSPEGFAMHPLYIDRDGNFYSTPGAERIVIPRWFGVINPPEDIPGGDYTLTLNLTENAGAEFISIYTCRFPGGIPVLLRFRLARLLFTEREEREEREERITAAVRAADHDLRQQSLRLESFLDRLD